VAIVESNAELGQQVVADAKEYVLHSWSVQNAVNPIPVAGAEGRYFWDYDGKRYLDFASQLVNVSIGHQHPRLVAAIKEQADKLCTIGPPMATEPRSTLARLIAEVTPGDLNMTFFTNGGAEANENAIKIARFFTGRHKIMARYRSYHGATAGSISLTGDPRRWAAEPGIPGVVRVLDPYHGIERGWESAETSLAMIEETMQLEGPHTIAAFILESVVGTNGILIPPDGYMQGVRKLCDKYGILMIADEVMAGFGRTGEWFAIDHWKVVPDLICMAKGLTASYLPLGAVGMRHHIAQHFQDKVFFGGLTYNSHPMGCAAALATIRVYEEDRLIDNAKKMGAVMKQLGAELQAKHPSVGEVRSIGLFGIFELIRSRKTKQPMAPFNGASEEMAALGKFFREQGLYTLVRWNSFYTNPPLCINEQQLREAFAIIDKGLEITDRAVKD
jgi:taurine--2-oxoglutarate transaminase